MRTATARDRAIANENRQIDESTSRAIAARDSKNRPRNALEAMASRFNVSAGALKDTLMKTAFSACRSEAEFISLVIVANTYNLNPLTKEIYAFPKKGGGIQPMVSYDGWIKIMNEHSQFDGIEFNHTLDDRGNIIAAEGIIYRKDRSRPTKKLIYLKEFKKNSEPWNNSPSHMLDVRCLCHTARIAFGVNAGIEGEEFEGAVIEGAAQPIASLPTRQTLADELDDEIPTFDQDTGEVYATDSRGMTEVDEETARRLDSNDGTLSDDNPTAEEGPEQGQRGEQVEEEEAPWQKAARSIRDAVAAAKSIKVLEAIERDWTNKVMNGVPDDAVVRMIDGEIAMKRKFLREAA